MPSYLWQNFLIDTQIQDQILQCLQELSDVFGIKKILEIWPGKWALTHHIVKYFDDVLLVEKDRTLLPHLQQFVSSATIVFEDILQYTIWKDTHRIVYGSLPYYISSPILHKFFVQHHYPCACFIVQKEFGEKIASMGRHKSYLRWLLNYRYDIKYIHTIPASAFNPAPRVQSCIITICSKDPIMSDDQFESLRILIEALGKFKRKTLSKSFKILGWEHITITWCQYQLPSDLAGYRLEQCTYNDIARMVV